MSYCRWGYDSHIYMYGDSNDKIRCVCCKYAPKMKSLFTTGGKEGTYFEHIKPCKECNGEGCDKCMIHTDTILDNEEQAIEHLKKHEKDGDFVPKTAYEMLEEDMKRYK